jgi:hypothetical protein
MQFVLGTNAYSGLSETPTATVAAALLKAGVPLVAKVWSELAYEHVRARVAPEAPSRLTSVFACCDVYEAFSFTEETGEAKHVHRGMVPSGVRWQLVDMGSFRVAVPPTPDATGFEEAWNEASLAAERYWLTGIALPDIAFCAEVLVAGPVQLEAPPLRLLDMMRADSLIA